METAIFGIVPAAILVAPVMSRPNFIVMQPDDFEFFEEWMPPAHFASGTLFDYPLGSDLPNINYLRENGVEFKQAYTASSMCGTSRYRYVSKHLKNDFSALPF